jgi:hypothetical protein
MANANAARLNVMESYYFSGYGAIGTKIHGIEFSWEPPMGIVLQNQ